MPDESAEFQVVDMRRLPSAQPGRLGKHDRLVIWQIDPQTRGVVTVPDETFSEAALQAAVRKDVTERKKWVGRRLKL